MKPIGCSTQGSMVRHLIETYWKDVHLKHGYELIYSPHIAKVPLCCCAPDALLMHPIWHVPLSQASPSGRCRRYSHPASASGAVAGQHAVVGCSQNMCCSCCAGGPVEEVRAL